MKPTLYLDVDGVLWVSVRLTKYGPAPCLAEFMDYILEHFIVRWCTTWATAGWMLPERMQELSDITGVPLRVWQRVRASKGWYEYKTETIDFTHPFVWVEDEILDKEKAELESCGLTDAFMLCNVFEDRMALCKTLERLKAERRHENVLGVDIPAE